MVIFPAIDIRGGKCVRLFKGDFAQETVFSDKPEEMAAKWEAQGGEFLHLVDLDGALAGRSVNLGGQENRGNSKYPGGAGRRYPHHGKY